MTETHIENGTTTNDRRLAILGYHKIGEPSPSAWETWFYIPEATFVSHLKFLRENGWQVIDVATLLRGLSEPDTLPQRAAMITFDDGYKSVLEVAMPHLLEFEYPAVHFVPTDYIGGRNLFDNDSEPEEEICDWNELHELTKHGVSVQAHGASHRHFSKLDAAEIEKELRQPKDLLEQRLGKPVEFFSFPYGDDGINPEATAKSLRQTGYRLACLYGGDPHELPIKDPFRLARIAMGPDTDLNAALSRGRSNVLDR
jgi:peptidoglycan/xylan/chitin deacetylase (PgdA/CDA1 family)